MSKTEEIIKVTLELPKQLADFIKDSWNTDNLSETLTTDVLNLCVSQLEADANETGAKPLDLASKYELVPIFQQYKVMPEYWTAESKQPISSLLTKANVQLIPVQIQLAKPFYDFLVEYRQYFGAKYPLEMICMQMVYSQVKRLFNELDGFVRNKNSFLDKSDFFTKNFFLGSVCCGDPEEE